jgi:hypothetical protein
LELIELYIPPKSTIKNLSKPEYYIRKKLTKKPKTLKRPLNPIEKTHQSTKIQKKKKIKLFQNRDMFFQRQSSFHAFYAIITKLENVKATI